MKLKLNECCKMNKTNKTAADEGEREREERDNFKSKCLMIILEVSLGQSRRRKFIFQPFPNFFAQFTFCSIYSSRFQLLVKS